MCIPALDGDEGQLHAPAALLQEKEPRNTLYRKLDEVKSLSR
jgi:hypothetical protein